MEEVEVIRSHPMTNEAEQGWQLTPLEGTVNDDDTPREEEQELPPMDRGMDAWLFLAACFAMEALVWGFAFSYGIFQAYYTATPEFANSGDIALVGTCAMVRT